MMELASLHHMLYPVTYVSSNADLHTVTGIVYLHTDKDDHSCTT